MAAPFTTIDLSTVNEDAHSFSQELGKNLIDWGFCGIKEHNIDQTLVQEVIKMFEEFFSYPDDMKMKYFRSNLHGARGYTPMKIEKAKNSPLPDNKEFWHIGRELTENHPFRDWMQDNFYISEIDNFQEKTSTLYMQFDHLGQKLLRAIAVFLDIESDYFEKTANSGNSIMRIIHYPPVKTEDKSERAGAHEDINLITLLIGGHQSGLELLTNKNTWEKVTVGRDVVICNIGDMLQRLTNHVLPSTTHRVTATREESKNSRFSIPFFVHPNPDWYIQTLDKCVSKTNKNKYPEGILAEDYLKQRLKEINLA